MKKIVISFGDEKYRKSQDLLEKTSLSEGKADSVISYTQGWLKTTEFWKEFFYFKQT